MDLATEKQLIEQARKDPLAFGRLYDVYYPKISNYLLHRLPQPHVAADDVYINGQKAKSVE